MLGEYGILINSKQLLTELSRFPDAVIRFLQTSNGQLSAAVIMVVVLLLWRKKR
ncbi:MAG: hypothetical protein ACU841_15670 [Gammaproteobacteria bacterium]